MPSRRRTSKDSPAKLARRMKRRCRVVLIRSKGELLGYVDAHDAPDAEAVAAVQFKLECVSEPASAGAGAGLGPTVRVARIRQISVERIRRLASVSGEQRSPKEQKPRRGNVRASKTVRPKEQGRLLEI